MEKHVCLLESSEPFKRIEQIEQLMQNSNISIESLHPLKITIDGITYDLNQTVFPRIEDNPITRWVELSNGDLLWKL